MGGDPERSGRSGSPPVIGTAIAFERLVAWRLNQRFHGTSYRSRRFCGVRLIDAGLDYQQYSACSWEATMADRPGVHPSSDDQSDVAKFVALVDAPITALGLPERAADAVAQALGVKTVRDLAENKYVRRAQAILALAEGKNPQ
jgi:hypothetical protein